MGTALLPVWFLNHALFSVCTLLPSYRFGTLLVFLVAGVPTYVRG